MMDADHEKALLQRVHGGDRGALGDLLRTHQRRLYNVCLRMVSHPDDAAELTQDVLVKVVEKIDTFRGDAKLTTWMTRIAMNLSISHLRKRRLRQTVSIDAPSGSSNGRAAGDGLSLAGRLPEERELSPDRRVERGEMLDELQAAIAGLDDDQRAVLVLRDLEQWDYQQIAESLELPVGTVKSRLFRARLALRERMNPHAEPTGPAGNTK